jgi:hypothetical protein
MGRSRSWDISVSDILSTQVAVAWVLGESARTGGANAESRDSWLTERVERVTEIEPRAVSLEGSTFWSVFPSLSAV